MSEIDERTELARELFWAARGDNPGLRWQDCAGAALEPFYRMADAVMLQYEMKPVCKSLAAKGW